MTRRRQRNGSPTALSLRYNKGSVQKERSTFDLGGVRFGRALPISIARGLRNSRTRFVWIPTSLRRTAPSFTISMWLKTIWEGLSVSRDASLRRSVWLWAPRLRKTTAGFLSKSTEPKRRTYMHTSFLCILRSNKPHKIWDGKRRLSFQAVRRERSSHLPVTVDVKKNRKRPFTGCRAMLPAAECPVPLESRRVVSLHRLGCWRKIQERIVGQC